MNLTDCFSGTDNPTHFLGVENSTYLQVRPDGAVTVWTKKNATWTAEGDIGGQSTSSNSFQTASVTLTDAQIKAIPSTPVIIIPAPGANKIIMTFGLSAVFNGLGNYTGISSDCALEFGYNGQNGAYACIMEEDVVGATVSSLLATGGKTILLAYPVQVVAQAAFGDAGYTWNGTPYLDIQITNRAFQILALNTAGNFTGGNAANSLKVVVYYMVVDV